MSVATQSLRPPSRTLMFLEGRAFSELGAFLGALPLLSLAPKGDGHPVLVLPGLVASDVSTRPLRSFLRTRGYAVSGWRQGRNLGLRHGVQHGPAVLLRGLRRSLLARDDAVKGRDARGDCGKVGEGKRLSCCYPKQWRFCFCG